MPPAHPLQQSGRIPTPMALFNTGISLQPSDNPLEIAVEKFIKDNPKHQLSQFRKTTYNDLCHAVSRVQQDQENRRETMNLARIQSFLEAMNQFGKVIEVFLNVADALAFVWGPMKFLLQVFFSVAQSRRRLADRIRPQAIIPTLLILCSEPMSRSVSSCLCSRSTTTCSTQTYR